MPDLNDNPFISNDTSLFPTTSGVGGFDITPGLSSMNRARADLQDQLNYINNIRKMIRDVALEGGASWEDANKAATDAVPITSTTSEEEELDILTSTTDDDTTQTEIIDDKTDEPTLADIIGGWLERQTGPVTQERIRGVLDRYGKTVGDFNEAVADVEGIPEFEDFVTEADLATPPPDVVEDTTVTDKPKPSTTTTKADPTELPKPTTTPTTTTDEEEEEEEDTTDDEEYVDLNAPKPQIPTPGLPQQPTTEPEPAQQGMFAFAAASPNRTTSEVLAPDLFKIDANIPLVGRLTQASPMATPQYLLSGISQRYKV